MTLWCVSKIKERGNVKCCVSFAEGAIKILLLIDVGAGTLWHNYSDITDQMGWQNSQGLEIQDRVTEGK